MNEQTDERQASAGQVERPVRPVAWMESPHGAIRANLEYRWTAPQAVAWNLPLYGQHQLDAAVAAERERCAKVCDEEHRRDDLTGDYRYGAGICAMRIRGA